MTTFHGLFIGVVRYASPFINELGGAVRDAEALHALFADNLGKKDAILLTDASVTRRELLAQFKDRLAQVQSDDFVVITYAGHGSDDFFLLPYDADPDELPNTALALDELVDLFREIPARNVLLVLDCCFSGGAGARVFVHSPTTRSVQSAEEKLRRLANDGRVILTAADTTQEAIEDPVSGHGVLTGYLLEALRGVFGCIGLWVSLPSGSAAPDFTPLAKRGCCSHHQGVCGCVNGAHNAVTAR